MDRMSGEMTLTASELSPSLLSFIHNASLTPITQTLLPRGMILTNLTTSPMVTSALDAAAAAADGGVFGTNSSVADDFSILRWLQYLLVPAIVTLGVAANFLALIVYVASRLRRLSCSIYLAALTVTDSGFLLCLLTRWAQGVWITRWNLCPVNYYLTGVFSFLSMAYVLGYTAERYLATCWPLQRKTWCTKKRATCIVVACLVFSLITFIPTLLLFEVRLLENHSSGPQLQCAARVEYETVLKWTSVCSMCFFWLIPTLLTILLNARIIHKMAHHDSTIRVHSSGGKTKRQNSGKYNQNTSNTTTDRFSTTSSLCGSQGNLPDRCSVSNTSFKPRGLLQNSATSNSTNNNGGGNYHHSHRRSSYKITRMLVVSSSAFIVMGLPYEVLKEYHYFSYDNWSLDDILDQNYSMTYKVVVFFVYHLYYLNYGVDFFIYNVAGKNFRLALSEVIHDVGEYVVKAVTCPVKGKGLGSNPVVRV